MKGIEDLAEVKMAHLRAFLAEEQKRRPGAATLQTYELKRIDEDYFARHRSQLAEVRSLPLI